MSTDDSLTSILQEVYLLISNFVLSQTKNSNQHTNDITALFDGISRLDAVEIQVDTIDNIIKTLDTRPHLVVSNDVMTTDSNADGSGIVIKGDTDKTILYNAAYSQFNFSEPINVPDLLINGKQLLGYRTEPSNIPTSTRHIYTFDANGKHLDIILNDNHGMHVIKINNVSLGIGDDAITIFNDNSKHSLLSVYQNGMVSMLGGYIYPPDIQMYTDSIDY